MSRRRHRRYKRYLRYAAIVLSVVFCLSAVLLVLSLWENSHSSYPDVISGYGVQTVEYMGEEYVQRDDVEAVLLLGLDKYEYAADDSGYNNDQRADFLLLLVFDKENETCFAIQLNRDTMVEMNVLGVAGEAIGKVTQQLALAHTYGNGKQVSCVNTVDSVSELLFGLEIKHYVSLTMDAVPIYNDLLGGVSVEVLHDFSGVDDTLIKGETVTLYGEHALNYVRERKGVADSSNEKRMERQAQYLEGMFSQTKKSVAEDKDFALKAVKELSQYFVTDCTPNQIHKIFESFSTYTFTSIYQIKGEYTVGERFMEFYPDAEQLKRLVVELCYEKYE